MSGNFLLSLSISLRVKGLKVKLLLFILLLLTENLVYGRPVMMEGTTPGFSSFIALDASQQMIVAAGVSNGTGIGDFDIVLAAIGTNGKLLWEKAYGGGGRDLVSSVKILPNGSILVAGGSASFRGGWIFLVDEKGNIVWSRTYNTEMIFSAVPYGTEILALSSASERPLLLKLTSDGLVERAYVINTSLRVVPVTMKALSGEGIYIAGIAQSNVTSSTDFWLAKVDDEGNLLWEKTYGENGTERLYNIEVDGQGVTLVGYTTSFGGGTDVNLLAVRTDLEGNVLWAKVIGGSREDWANSVSLLPSGELVLGGITYSAQTPQAWLVILSRDGKVEKSLVMGTGGVDWIRAVDSTTSGEIILAGGINGTSNGAGSLLTSRLFLGMIGSASENFTGCHVSAQRLDFPVKAVQVRVWTHSGEGSLGLGIISRSAPPQVKEVKNGLEPLCPGETSTASPSSTTTTASSTTATTTHSENPESPSSAKGRICGPGAAVAVPLIVLWLRKKR